MGLLNLISVNNLLKKKKSSSGGGVSTPGLRWTAYSGHTGNDVNFNTSFPIYPTSGLSPQGYDPPSNGQSTGLTSNLTNLSTGTNGNFVGDGSGAGNNHHHFCIEWVGMIYTQSYSGTWTFNTNSDDMSMLWVGPEAVSGWTLANAIVNNEGYHGMNSRSGTISLNANTYYPIRIQFSEAGGGYELITTVTPPGGTAFTNGTGFYFINSGVSNALTQITAVAPLWGAYSAEAWDSGTNVLSDLTGNGRNATTSGVTYTSGSGGGATSSIGYLSGTNSSKINWPAGSVPSTFTIASLTSYTGTNNHRILQSTSGNWLHGHWNGGAGVHFYEGWRTSSNSASSVSNVNNWLICVGTNNTGIAIPNNIIVNGVGKGTANGGASNLTLTINNPGTYNEYSNFKFSQLLIWPSGLTTTQMQSVNTILQNYLNIGSSVSVQALLSGVVPSVVTSYTGSPVVSTSSGNTILSWASNGSFVVSGGQISAKLLIIAGGGGGGYDGGGGGGGGGILEETLTISPGTYNVTVGEAGTASGGYSINAGKGGNSIFGAYTAIGGGGGGTNHGLTNGSTNANVNGGSGGGAGAYLPEATGPGTGTSGQGYNGGTQSYTSGGGGGGGGGAGANGTGGGGGAGGIGFLSNITGTNTYYSGGGGAGSWGTSVGGAGGAGGGGGGGAPSSGIINGSAATYYGGGGGGGGYGGTAAASGYKGIVIISYN